MLRFLDWFLSRHSWVTDGPWGATRRVCMKCGKVQERPTPAHRWLTIKETDT